ncbi:MAG: Uma2 family endonuclease [Planctomycetota bacterium]
MTGNTTTSQRRLTWDDYVRMPDDGMRREIIDGVLFMSPAPQEPHQETSLELVGVIRDWMRATGDNGKLFYAPFDVILEESDDTVTVVQPDILYVRGIKRRLVEPRGVVGAPDLVIEIVSPSHPDRDRVTKRELYERHTIPEYWIVDPDARTIEVLRLDGAFYRQVGLFGQGDVVTTPLMPGPEIDVAYVTRAL